MTRLNGKGLTIACVAVLAISGVLSLGNFLPNRSIQIGGSATSERHLLLNAGMVGIVTVNDPTGMAIPYYSRASEVTDQSTWRQKRSGGIWLLWRTGEATVNNRQGQPVTITYRIIVYLLLPAAAVLILTVQICIAGFRALHRRWQHYQSRRQLIRQVSLGEACPACGYDVRMNENACPECGQTFRRMTVVVATAPTK